MLQKLRWKFSAIMMAIVILLLAVIFITLYYTTKMNYVQRSMETLHNAMTENFPGNAKEQPAPEAGVPGGRPPARPSRPRRQDSPILIVDVKQDTYTVVKNQLLNTGDQDARALVLLADETDSGSGIIKDRHLRYLRGKTMPDGTVRYGFVDIYEEQNSLYWQVIHSSIIGACSLAAFFLFSLLLSKWATRPVEEAWEQQRQFVADASHELKTPLTVILSNADMIAGDPDIADARNRQRISHIQAESIRMKQLVESLLTLARSDAVQAASIHSPVDLSFIVNSSIMAFEPMVFDTGKHLTYDIETDIQVNGDEKKLRQLTDILIDNACKYSREHGAITVNLKKAGAKEALLTVSNEGTPLTKEEIKHLFLRFYRADTARSDIPGYGLGLSIAQNIVREHGGKIDAASEGRDTNCFTVRLPLTEQPPKTH